MVWSEGVVLAGTWDMPTVLHRPQHEPRNFPDTTVIFYFYFFVVVSTYFYALIVVCTP